MKQSVTSVSALVLGFGIAMASATSAQAATQWIELNVGGTAVRSILALPEGPGPHPAVIFNHGTGVRHHGYEGSKSKGQADVKDFTDALVKDGYIALAPIRRFLADDAYVERGRQIGGSEEWMTVIAKGIETVQAAKAYLTNRDDVAKDKIAVVGFSEGGNVTLWSAARTPGFKAVVLMSPPFWPSI
ncbi:MAG: dienelactone hydrolase family protein [Proteobacteria bacterium]|nr:dienelactone hydrolase family protein [Pseudomonadota bacterium]